jgi:hypothetical protein
MMVASHDCACDSEQCVRHDDLQCCRGLSLRGVHPDSESCVDKLSNHPPDRHNAVQRAENATRCITTLHDQRRSRMAEHAATDGVALVLVSSVGALQEHNVGSSLSLRDDLWPPRCIHMQFAAHLNGPTICPFDGPISKLTPIQPHTRLAARCQLVEPCVCRLSLCRSR